MYNLDNSTPVATTGTYLAGNAIHKVKFKGAEKTTLTTKDGTVMNVVRVKFQELDGDKVHEDTIFEPKSNVRTKNEQNGYENASQVEEFQVKLRQYISALNPNLDKDITSGTKKLQAKNWEEMATIIVAALNSKGKTLDREVEIKLLKNKSGFAIMPGFLAGLTKPNSEGVSSVFHRTKFIGEGLEFSDRELAAINKAAAANPTNMSVNSAAQADLGGSNADLDELDLDDL